MIHLAEAVDLDDTQIVVDSDQAIRLPYRVVIDSESLLVTGIHERTWIVHRDNPATHDAGAAITKAYPVFGDRPLIGSGTGIQGPPGPAGAEGPAGPEGPQGETGPEGPAGPKGDAGDPGPQGDPGPSGDTGPAGSTGADGAAGPQGEPGVGIQGPQGQQGPIGPDGPAGPEGPAGQTGSTGATGNTGLTGPTGAQGPAGPQGPQGLQGVEGPAGPEGPQGAQGAKGDTGLTGPQGDTGAAGTDASIPTGIIAMWSGAVAQIPSGWFLRNGLNGTPDLRDKFIIGAGGARNPGTTGGAATHGHTVNQPADHATQSHSAHAGATVANHTDVTNHVHVQSVNSATTGGLSGYTPDTSTNTSATSGYSTANPTSVGVAAMVHSVGQANAHSDHAALSHSGVSVGSTSNDPVNYALAFIMKA